MTTNGSVVDHFWRDILSNLLPGDNGGRLVIDELDLTDYILINHHLVFQAIRLRIQRLVLLGNTIDLYKRRYFLRALRIKVCW